MEVNSFGANETETISLQTFYLYYYASKFIDIVTISKLIEKGMQRRSHFMFLKHIFCFYVTSYDFQVTVGLLSAYRQWSP